MLTGVAVGITAALVPIQEIAELTNIGTLFAFALVCRTCGFCVVSSLTSSAISGAVGAAGTDHGRAVVSVPDGQPADSHMDQIFRVDGGWACDLFRLQPLP